MLRIMLATLALVTAPLSAAPPVKWAGTWRNAANSVHLRVAPCGRGMCGTVIWASDKAKADVAVRGGTLIGAQLFRDFTYQSDGLWHGAVFVPDIGTSVIGTIHVDGPTRLTGTGCLFGNLGCKTQVWTKLP